MGGGGLGINEEIQGGEWRSAPSSGVAHQEISIL